MKQKAKEVYKKHASHLLKEYHDVTAVDVGYRKKDGVELREGEVCLLVWVKKKLPESEVKSEELLPKEIDGVAVDVREGKEV